jgi:hypothetical protein
MARGDRAICCTWAAITSLCVLQACGLALDDYDGYRGGEPDAGSGGTAAVACGEASQCPGDDTECGQRTCVEGLCGMDAAPAGEAGTQTSGDCKVNLCDGEGALVAEDDLGDIEFDDNECTQDLCEAGVPKHPAESTSTPCGSGTATHCDGNGACVGCDNATECPSAACTSYECVEQVCTASFAPTGTNCGDPESCSNGVLTLADTCNGSGICDSGSTVNCHPYTCAPARDGGGCNRTCTTDADCAAGYFCDKEGSAGAGFCMPIVAIGLPCTVDAQCDTTFCVDGICCDTACTDLCVACDGDVTGLAGGFCFPVYNGTDPDDECAGAQVCDANTQTCI